MASGLQVWSQTAASNSNADSTVNWAEGQAPSSVNDSARALMASMAKWRDDNNGTLVTTGSSAAYTVTTNQTEGSLTDGFTIALRFHATIDTSATINVDSLGAKPIQALPGFGIGFGHIRKSAIRRLTYSSTGSGQWILHGATEVPPGRVVSGAYTTPAPDELLCDGTSYLRATYPDLFSAIGTTFGAADGSHFSVPDVTGRSIYGKESSATRLTTAGSGVNGGTLGAAGGVESVTLTTDAIPSHSHSITDPTHTHTGSVAAGASVSGTASGGVWVGGGPTAITINAAATGITGTNAFGGGGAHSNLSPGIVLNYFIKI